MKIKYQLAIFALLLCVCGCSALRSGKKPASALSPEFQQVGQYKFGESNAVLNEIAARIDTQSNNPVELRKLEQQLLALLQAPESTMDVRHWACRQLAIAASDDSIALLAGLLADAQLASSARYALERIPGPRANQALVKAVRIADPRLRIGAINSLGARRTEAAVPELVRQLNDSDWAVAEAAANALGRIGNPACARALLRAQAQAKPEQAVMLADALLLCAGRAATEGQKANAFDLYKKLNDSPPSPPVRVAALRGMVLTGGEAGAGLILQTLKSENPQLRALAIHFIREIKGTELTRKLAEQLPQLDPAMQTLMMQALADRGDAAALPPIQDQLASENEAVQRAAISAMGELGDVSTITPLLTLAVQSKGAKQKLAREALERLESPEVNSSMIAAIKESDVPAQQELIRSLGARQARASVPELLSLAATSPHPPVRSEALKALATIADPNHLAQTTQLILLVQNQGDRDLAVKAAVASAKKLDDPTQRNAPFVDALNKPADPAVKASLLTGLGNFGGRDALNVVQAALADQDPAVREAAVKALSNWPSPEPMPLLLNIACSEQNEKMKMLAFKGYLQLAALPSDRPAVETVALFGEALKRASRAEEKRMIFSSLGTVRHPGALGLTLAYLNDKGLGTEAAIASLQIMHPFCATYPELAKQLLERVRFSSKDESVLASAAELQGLMEKTDDFILAWQVAGPYFEKEKGADELFNTAFAPEQNDVAGVAWKPVYITNEERPWMIDFFPLLQDGGNMAAYLKTSVYSPQAQEVLFQAGSDDGNKIWVNGELVNAVNERRGAVPATDQGKVMFKEGWNEVLMKVVQGGGNWEACLKFVTPDGGKIAGLHVRAGDNDYTIEEIEKPAMIAKK